MSAGGRSAGLALVAALLLVLTACTSGGASGSGGGLLPGRARVDVSTPALAKARRAAGVEACTPGTGAAVTGGLPDVTLPCLGGGPAVRLSGLRGPLVVNLWASWCGPCRHELPFYQAFAEKHRGRVGVLGVDYQDVQPAAALALAKDTGVTYPLLADPQGDLDGATPFPPFRGLPFLALVDARGRVVHREFVQITSERQLSDLVEKYLGAGR